VQKSIATIKWVLLPKPVNIRYAETYT